MKINIYTFVEEILQISMHVTNQMKNSTFKKVIPLSIENSQISKHKN